MSLGFLLNFIQGWRGFLQLELESFLENDGVNRQFVKFRFFVVIFYFKGDTIENLIVKANLHLMIEHF